MKKLILAAATVLALGGAYAFFSSPCCGPNDVCKPEICCPDNANCSHKTATANLDRK